MTLGAIAAAAYAAAQKRAADGIVDAGEGMLQRLAGWVRQRMSGDRVATVALERVQDAPDSQPRVDELAEVIDQRAGRDHEFAEALAALVEQVKSDAAGGRFVTEVFGGAQVGKIVNVNQAGDIHL
ncbi:MAG: hypothetical protein QOJ89_1749 [bacterium]|jgi:hypothetical protein